MNPMKKIRNLLLLLLVSIVAVSCASTRITEKQREESALLLKKVIDSGNYTVDATMAYPHRGRNVPLTSQYTLEVKNDSVLSHLPFYGRAFSVPYGGGEGLHFQAPLTDYVVTYKPKGAAQIKFNARTDEDLFKFTVDVYPGGAANISVVMQQRESINYSGSLSGVFEP